METSTRFWWAVALRGAAAILFGLMALIWPGITLFALVLLFGAYALVDGVFTLIAAFSRRGEAQPDGASRLWLIAQGVAGIGLGVLAVVWPGITALALLWVIAAWAMVTGVLQIVTAIRLRRRLRREWMLIVSGVLSVLWGILLVVWPAAGALAVVALIAVSAIVLGAALLTSAVELRRLQRDVSSIRGNRHRPATA